MDSDGVPILLVWGTPMFSPRPVAAAIRFPSLVSIGLPGGCDKFQSPQRRRWSYFWGSAWWGSFLLAVTGDGSLGQGKSRTETGPAPLPSAALAHGGHPGPQRPLHRTSTLYPELSSPSPEPLRSHFARYWPLSCLRLRGTPHSFLPPPLPRGCARRVAGRPAREASGAWAPGAPDLAEPLPPLPPRSSAWWGLPAGQRRQPGMTFVAAQVGGAGRCQQWVSH